MFFDDQLYNRVKGDFSGDFEKLYVDLIQIAGNYITVRLQNLPQPPLKTEVKEVLDQAFNSWDLFVKRLEKENHLSSDIFKICSLKTHFLSNEELKIFYEGL